jgi:hypothetical protein
MPNFSMHLLSILETYLQYISRQLGSGPIKVVAGRRTV